MKMREGFTLIELLVVILIVAILIAILFPLFAGVRAKARQATCQSNLKQIALGFLMYAQDYDEHFPGPYWYDELVKGKYCPKPVDLQDGGIFKCPEWDWSQTYFNSLDDASWYWKNPGTGIWYSRWFPYAFNEVLSYRCLQGIYNTAAADAYAVADISAIKADSTRLLLLCDSAWKYDCNTVHICQIWRNDAWTKGYWKGPHNSNGKVYAFVDGHVKWMSPEDAHSSILWNPR